MTRVPAAVCALVLWTIPFATAPVKPVAVLGALAVALAGLGIAGLWRWPVAGSACLFLLAYSGALTMARAPFSVGGAVAFSLALLWLLESVELGRALRRADVDGRLVRSLVAARLGFATAALGATLLVLALARGFAASIPFAAAPFVAGLAALGVVLALATLVRNRGT